MATRSAPSAASSLSSTVSSGNGGGSGGRGGNVTSREARFGSSGSGAGVGGRCSGNPRMSVGEFVDASFASFERSMSTRLSIPNPPGSGSGRVSVSTRGADKREENSCSTGRGYDVEFHRFLQQQQHEGSGTSNPKETSDGKTNSEGENHEEDAEGNSGSSTARVASFLTLLTSLYLPLILLWLRRSMFGTANLLRSLVIGHALRLLLTYAVVLPPPPDWIADPLTRLARGHFMQKLSTLILTILGQRDGVEYRVDKYSMGAFGTGSLGIGGGFAGSITGAGGGWPPPAFSALAIFTLLAFIVHPDGFTWIILGKIWDGMKFGLKLTVRFLRMIQDGTIPTFFASGTLVCLLMLGMIIRRTLSRGKGKHGPTPNEKPRHKGKRGKKGRGRHGGGGNSSGGPRGRGRIRGGHYRSTKDLFNSPPRRSPSRSRSRSKSRLEQNTSLVAPSHPTVEPKPIKSQDQPLLHENDQQSARSGTITEPTSPAPAPADSHTLSRSSPDENISVVGGGLTKTQKDGGFSPEVTSVESGRKSHVRRGGRNSKTVLNGEPSNSKQQTSSSNYQPSAPSFPKQARPSSPPASFEEPNTFAHLPTPPESPPAIPVSSPQSPVSAYGHAVEKPTFNHVTRDESRTSLGGDFKNYTTSSFFSAPVAEGISCTIGKSKDAVSAPSQSQDYLGESVRSSIVVSPPTLSSDSFVPGTQRSVPSAFGPPFVIPDSTAIARHSLRSRPQATNLFYSMPGDSAGQTAPGPKAPVLRYSVPNYASSYAYSQGDARYTPGKMELAAFLAQVGLIGAACARLLADLADVDALSHLSDAEFDSYNIGLEKRTEIGVMLEARRRRQLEISNPKGPVQQQPRLWNPTIVRPPPGLGLDRDIANPRAVAPSGSALQRAPLPFVGSSSLGPTGYTVGSTQFGIPHLSSHSDVVVRSRCNTGESSFGSVCEDLAAPLSPLSGATIVGAMGHESRCVEFNANEDDEDSKIEEDLKELGGRMVGSVLDF